MCCETLTLCMEADHKRYAGVVFEIERRFTLYRPWACAILNTVSLILDTNNDFRQICDWSIYNVLSNSDHLSMFNA